MGNIVYPPVNQQHVLEYIFEIGWCVNNGQGATPISFGDILDWQEVTGIPLTSWEGRTIKNMSKAFCQMVHDKDAPNPLVAVSKDQATSLLAKFDNIMGK
jgi:hypothetical protein